MTNMALLAFTEQLAEEIGSLYRGIRYDKTRLLEFMDINDWFGIENDSDLETLRSPLTLWLSAFKQTDDVKLDLLLEHFKSEYPRTCKLYREFVISKGIRNKAYSWKLLDCIFANIGKEITDCDEAEVEAFIRLLDAEYSLVTARAFADFSKFARLSEWDYRFGSRGKLDSENGAYSLGDYATMAYCIFNEDMWKRQDLVNKATKSETFADLWLYTAMQFVCALRGTDLARLPAPSATQDPGAIVDELCIRLKLKPTKPSKTERYQDIPELKLIIPESLRTPLGTIISIAMTHHPDVKPGEQFIFPGDYRHSYKQFFGDEFVAVLGKQHFSIRRCNKSYLQGIDMVTEMQNEPGKPKGYMLAALARSHKGGIAKLPEITDIYLKDANFTGYTPEFIAREMFERGVFSFIPNALLEIYAGEGYRKLSVQNQTSIICKVGLRPSQIENVLSLAEMALLRAKNTAASIVDGLRKREIGAVLQNIASGNAPGRTREYLCLMTAAGQVCPHPNRAGCIGCGYEILTKSTLQFLMREADRLQALCETASQNEAWRYTALLNTVTLPAIAEILSCAEEAGYDCTTTGNGRQLQPHDGG